MLINMSVYFIYEKTQSPTSVYKVGQSKKPYQRMRNLQTGNMRKLAIYRIIECATKKQAETVEATIHERYANQRVHGEWFQISQEEVDRICEEIMALRDAELAKAVSRGISNNTLKEILPSQQIHMPLKHLFI